MRTLPPLISAALLCLAPASALAAPRYPWRAAPVPEEETLAARFPVPAGFTRAPCGATCEWLRGLPLRPGRPEVRLFDGRTKPNQAAHLAVVDVDVGKRDLQQCADAVLRLWAEEAYARRGASGLCIPLTSGAPLRWDRWAAGERPSVHGRSLQWKPRSAPDGGHAAFRRFLDFAFTYAGTASLQQYMVERVPLADIRPGDLFLQGGFPGHAVAVVDVVEGPGGRRAFALAQSYMPAQEVHVLDNPSQPGTPWYELAEGAPLVTPEWTFPPGSLARFKQVPAHCP
ncbi:MAG: DUF4846 domain-containing protein [Deltaproteobacteria bacterium]|nr:DUF4846 domain-containing protein [Deltaproteobacteria bacterium]